MSFHERVNPPDQAISSEVFEEVLEYDISDEEELDEIESKIRTCLNLEDFAKSAVCLYLEKIYREKLYSEEHKSYKAYLIDAAPRLNLDIKRCYEYRRIGSVIMAHQEAFIKEGILKPVEEGCSLFDFRGHFAKLQYFNKAVELTDMHTALIKLKELSTRKFLEWLRNPFDLELQKNREGSDESKQGSKSFKVECKQNEIFLDRKKLIEMSDDIPHEDRYAFQEFAKAYYKAKRNGKAHMTLLSNPERKEWIESTVKQLEKVDQDKTSQ